MTTPNSVTATLYASKGKYSDFKIVCNGQPFHVHRAVLGVQSDVLDRMMDPKNGFKEGETRLLDLDDNEAHIVECMLSFLYTKNYDDGRGK